MHVALRIWNYLEGALVDSRAMAYIHSGNGRQIHLALDSLRTTKSASASLLASSSASRPCSIRPRSKSIGSSSTPNELCQPAER